VCDQRAWLTACLVIALAPASVAAQAPAAASLQTLTTIKAIRALSQDEGAKGYPVRIRGVVTHNDETADTGLIVHDGEFGQYVVSPDQPEALTEWRAVSQGEAIEIEGRTVRGGFAPNVMPAAVRRFGPGRLPTPKRIAFGSMLTGRNDCDYVEIVGVVQRTWRSPDPQMATLFAEVSFEEGVIRVMFWDHEPKDLDRLIDARVRLRGNVGTLFGRTEQLRGVSLFAGRTREVVVLEPPPEPFSIPVRSIRSIYNYSAAGEVNRRIRIHGVVTSYIPGHPVEISDFSSTARFRYVRHVIYVNDGGDGVRIETEQPQRLEPGTIVDVAGFPAVTPGKPILTNAIFKVAGQAPQPAAATIDGPNVLSPDNDATLVRMNGQLLSVLTSSTERVLVLRVGPTVLNANLEADASTERLERIRPGSVVSVTGVYSYRWGPPPSFQLFLRSANDVTVLQVAPWWTVQHTAVMLVILAFGACGVALWVRMTSHRKHREYLAVLNERSRVGRELHDTLEQGLAGISLQLEAVAGSLPESSESARRSLDVAKQMLLYSQEEARRSVMDLRSQALESRDLAGALSDLAQQMTNGTSAEAVVRVVGTPQRLDASREHHLLRVGLEALTNAIKHSGAYRINITLQFRDDATELTVEDDGCGLENGLREVPGTRFGLQGIRERVDKLGGVLQIESAAGKGTRLTVVVPRRQGPSASDVTPLLGESWRTS
jgi:signal transduction histidine kinase